jgi:FkbM family methyltransferase
MNENCNSQLWTKACSKGFHPSHVAEVGVWHPNTSNIFHYIKDGVKATLVEPDIESIALIKNKFNMDNVTLHEVAICDFSGEVELCKRESSTFVSSLPSSPALVNDDCNISESDTFIAKAMKFSEIDDGTIELLSVDTEGSEWHVIKNMISRPSILSIETHGGAYKNPYLSELQEWLKSNNYKLWYMDKSDSVYVLKGAIKISNLDNAMLFLSKTQEKLKSVKKMVCKKIKGEKVDSCITNEAPP